MRAITSFSMQASTQGAQWCRSVLCRDQSELRAIAISCLSEEFHHLSVATPRAHVSVIVISGILCTAHNVGKKECDSFCVCVCVHACMCLRHVCASVCVTTLVSHCHGSTADKPVLWSRLADVCVSAYIYNEVACSQLLRSAFGH